MTEQKKKSLSPVWAVLAALGTIAVLLLICLTVTDGKVGENAIDFYQSGSWWDDNWQMHDSLDGMTFTFKSYGTVIAAGVLAALLIGWLLTGRKDTKRYCVFAFIAAAAGLVLSRVLYCVICPIYYSAHFLPAGTLFRMWDGGMSMAGALLGLLLAGLIVPGRKGSAAVTAPLFIAGARIAEQFSTQIGHGISVEFEGIFAVERGWGYRLNVHLIETIMALVILGMVLVLPSMLRKITTKEKAESMRLPAFLVLYGISQILMESLRKDEHMVWGFVKVQMILYLLMAMAGMAAVCYEGKPLTDLKKNKWLYGFLVSLGMSLPVITFEFGLDKSDIPNGLIYAGYVLVLLFFIVMFFLRMKKHLKEK